ncbi:PREDICTED: cytospin-A-like, partial [Priapulus caudatus]|uniref:Cytospin-A-like n=1 Tax=Priapulus caudatus TaxID=37621 RepID=A0ABM1F700_PRICU
MEETHYSTNEELQATVNELEEYQETVTDLAAERQRLCDEKQVLMGNLCSQTEKLEKCRAFADHLKSLLYDETIKTNFPERERHLAALLKQSQEEVQELRGSHEEATTKLHLATDRNKDSQGVIEALQDKAR